MITVISGSDDRRCQNRLRQLVKFILAMFIEYRSRALLVGKLGCPTYQDGDPGEDGVRGITSGFESTLSGSAMKSYSGELL